MCLTRMPKRMRDDAVSAGAAKRHKAAPKPKRTYKRNASTFAPETKYFDTFYSATVDSAGDFATSAVPMTSYMNADGSTVSAYTDCALIPSAIGSGYGQVIGNKYILKSLRVRGELFPSATTGSTAVGTPCNVRLMLIQDTQPNGTQAQPSLLLTDWGSASQINFSFQSVSSGMGGRFRVLYDKTVELNPTASVNNAAGTTVSTIVAGRTFNISKSWKKGLKVIVKSGASTPAIASLGDCNIFLVAHAAATGPSITIRGNARAYYVD